MLTKGNEKLTLFQGNRKPYALYKGGKQITGAELTELKGTDNIKWESPYKATIPSINTYGLGTQEQMSGNNLVVFPYEELAIGKSKEHNGITFTCLDDGGVHIKGHSAGSEYFVISSNLDLGSQPIRTNKGEVEATNGEFVMSKYLFYNGNKKLFVNTFGFNSAEGLDIDEIIYPQVNKGTKLLPYEPYCGGIPAPNPNFPIEPKFNANNKILSRSKNLFDISKITDRNYLTNKDNTIAVKSADWIRTNEFLSDICFSVKPNKEYYVFYKSKGSLAVGKYPDNMRNISSGEKTTFTEKELNGYLMFRGPSSNEEVKYSEIMFCEINSMEYEPYRDNGSVNIPVLRALPNGLIKDEYNPQTQTITRRIKELIITGKENWARFPLGKSIQYYFHSNDSMPSNKYREEYLMISSYFTPMPISNRGTDLDNANACYLASDSICFNPTDFSTDTEWRAFLKDKYDKGTPIIVWYALKEPVIEKVEGTPLIQDWNGQLIQTGGDAGLASMEAVIYTEYKK